MSRTILIEQINNMPDSLYKEWLIWIDTKFPAVDGWKIVFAIDEPGDYGFEVRIKAIRSDEIRSRDVAWDKVPIIQKYLRDTGAAQQAYDAFLESQENDRQRVRKTLLGDGNEPSHID